MLKISKEILKKAVFLIESFVMFSSFTGCAEEVVLNDIPTDLEKTVNTNDESTNEIPKEKEYDIYDFPFLENSVEEVKNNGEYDWIDAINVLESNCKEFMFIFDRNTTAQTKHKYELAIFEDEMNFGSSYYQIVTPEEPGVVSLENTKYHGGIIPVSENISILEMDEASGYGHAYTLLNHDTGATRMLIANSLMAANGYMIMTTGDEVSLLYSNGEPAISNKYDNIVYDRYTGYIYLNKGDATEVLDTVTNRARKLPTKVRDAQNGYLTVEVNDKEGVYYLEDLESDLVKKIPCEFDYITNANHSSQPLFSCQRYDISDENGDTQLYSAEGECLSEKYHYIGFDFDSSGYIDVVTSSNIYTSDETHTLINYNGFEVLSDVYTDWLHPIPLTNKVIFQKYDHSQKFGIMDFDGNYLIAPIYDRIILSPITDNNELVDYLLICRNEEEKNTVVFNSDIDVIISGDFGHYEALNMAVSEKGKPYVK